MAIAVDPKDKIPVILESDLELPEDQRTTFYVRPMTHREYRALLLRFVDKKGKPKDVTFAYEEIVKLIEGFVVGWDNFKTSSGVPVELKTTTKNGTSVWSDETWHAFSLELTRELFNKVFKIQNIARETAKN